MYKGKKTERQKYWEMQGLYLHNRAVTWILVHTTFVQMSVHHLPTSVLPLSQLVLSNAERHLLIFHPFISSLISCVSCDWEISCLL